MLARGDPEAVHRHWLAAEPADDPILEQRIEQPVEDFFLLRDALGGEEFRWVAAEGLGEPVDDPEELPELRLFVVAAAEITDPLRTHRPPGPVGCLPE